MLVTRLFNVDTKKLSVPVGPYLVIGNLGTNRYKVRDLESNCDRIVSSRDVTILNDGSSYPARKDVAAQSVTGLLRDYRSEWTKEDE